LSPVADIAAREAFDAATEPLGWKLRGYQHRGREFVRSRRGALLAYQMRLGKTPTTVAAHELDDGPIVVIAPLATRHVWNDWFARRWPGVEPVNVTGRRYDADVVIGSKIVFGHYDILPAWQSIAAQLRPAMLVFDEAHLLSKPSSRRTQAALTISTFADRVVATTGTPLWNKPAGLWPMLACLNPGGWGKFYDYAIRYCSGRPGSHGMVHDEPSNVDEFMARMTDVMLQLRWEDVADELPPTERAILYAPLHETDAYEIEVQAECVRDESRLRTPIGELARFRRLVGHLKVRTAADRAVELMAMGESVVVWTWHRELAEGIAQRIAQQRDALDVTVVHGKTPVKAREIAFEYARNIRPTALVMTMGVGQVGIDLSHARHEIFAELDFTPATVAQAEMRTFSPDRAMTVEYVVLDHAVDRRLAEILVAKCATAQRMGVPAAETAVDMLGHAFDLNDEGDMDRLMAAVLGGSE
jgi:SWI/SNF-related matrix-associated actin-dependent regulator 1 of chromatin subfamily A